MPAADYYSLYSCWRLFRAGRRPFLLKNRCPRPTRDNRPMTTQRILTLVVAIALGAGAWLYRHVEARPWGAWGAQKMAGIGMVLLPFLAVCAGFTWAFSY